MGWLAAGLNLVGNLVGANVASKQQAAQATNAKNSQLDIQNQELSSLNGLEQTYRNQLLNASPYMFGPTQAAQHYAQGIQPVSPNQGSAFFGGQPASYNQITPQPAQFSQLAPTSANQNDSLAGYQAYLSGLPGMQQGFGQPINANILAALLGQGR